MALRAMPLMGPVSCGLLWVPRFSGIQPHSQKAKNLPRGGPEAEAQLIECLPKVDKALGSIPVPQKPGVVLSVCQPSTWKAEAG